MQNEIKPAEIKIVASYISPEELNKNPELLKRCSELKAIDMMNFPAKAAPGQENT